MVKVRNHESVPFSRYLCLCNVLHICNMRAIPTYRAYRLYDMSSRDKLLHSLTLARYGGYHLYIINDKNAIGFQSMDFPKT